MQVHEVVRRLPADDVYSIGGPASHGDIRLVAGLLDGLGVAALLFGRRGELLYESAAFAVLARREPDALLAHRAPPEWLACCAAPAEGVGREFATEAAAGERVLRLGAGSTEVLLRAVPLAGSVPATWFSVVTVEVRLVGASLRDVLRDRYCMTRRELGIAVSLGDGSTLAAIATSLGISTHTARHHLERIYRKLGVNSRAAAVGRLHEIEATLRSTSAGASDLVARASTVS